MIQGLLPRVDHWPQQSETLRHWRKSLRDHLRSGRGWGPRRGRYQTLSFERESLAVLRRWLSVPEETWCWALQCSGSRSGAALWRLLLLLWMLLQNRTSFFYFSCFVSFKRLISFLRSCVGPAWKTLSWIVCFHFLSSIEIYEVPSVDNSADGFFFSNFRRKKNREIFWRICCSRRWRFHRGTVCPAGMTVSTIVSLIFFVWEKKWGEVSCQDTVGYCFVQIHVKHRLARERTWKIAHIYSLSLSLSLSHTHFYTYSLFHTRTLYLIYTNSVSLFHTYSLSLSYVLSPSPFLSLSFFHVFFSLYLSLSHTLFVFVSLSFSLFLKQTLLSLFLSPIFLCLFYHIHFTSHSFFLLSFYSWFLLCLSLSLFLTSLTLLCFSTFFTFFFLLFLLEN